MNKQELIEAIVAETGLTKRAAGEALDATIATIVKEVKKGGKVQLVGFGTFEQRKRAARKGINPQTGVAIKIPAAKVPHFSAGAAFREAVNGKKK